MTELTGRELDAAVGRKVMQLNIVAMDWPCGTGPDSGDYTASHRRDDPATWFDERGPVYVIDSDDWPPRPTEGAGDECAMVLPVPHYSTNIADAWQVVIRITDRDGTYGDQKWSFGLEFSSIIDWHADFTPRRHHPKARQYGSYVGSGITAPEAICRAALVAVEAQ